MTAIYVARGLTPELAQQVSAQLMAHDALGAHARDELQVSTALAARPVQAALTSAASFAVGAALPLAVAVVSPASSLLYAVAGSALVFFGIARGLGCTHRRRGDGGGRLACDFLGRTGHGDHGGGWARGLGRRCKGAGVRGRKRPPTIQSLSASTFRTGHEYLNQIFEQNRLTGAISQRDPFALSLSKGCSQGAPRLRQAQPERLRKMCLRHVPDQAKSVCSACSICAESY